MLAGTDDLYIACLEHFESLKSRFFDFWESVIPNFENLHSILHLNESEEDVNEEKYLEDDSLGNTWRKCRFLR